VLTRTQVEAVRLGLSLVAVALVAAWWITDDERELVVGVVLLIGVCDDVDRDTGVEGWP
jgi:hypothetical protein